MLLVKRKAEGPAASRSGFAPQLRNNTGMIMGNMALMLLPARLIMGIMDESCCHLINSISCENDGYDKFVHDIVQEPSDRKRA